MEMGGHIKATIRTEPLAVLAVCGSLKFLQYLFVILRCFTNGEGNAGRSTDGAVRYFQANITEVYLSVRRSANDSATSEREKQEIVDFRCQRGSRYLVAKKIGYRITKERNGSTTFAPFDILLSSHRPFASSSPTLPFSREEPRPLLHSQGLTWANGVLRRLGTKLR